MNIDKTQMQAALKQILLAGIEKNQTLKLYAIFDATNIKDLWFNLDLWNINHASLFQGEEADDLKEVSPFLVELKKDNEATDILLQEYGRSNSLYIVSELSFDALLQRFCNQFKMYTEYGESALLRFYDPAIFRHYIKLIDKERLEVFFNSAFQYYCEGVFPIELEQFQLKDGALYNETIELPGKQDEANDIKIRHDSPVDPLLLFGNRL